MKLDKKQALIDNLRAIIYLEVRKHYTVMDSDLITECVDFLMELEGQKRLTEDQVKKAVDSIFKRNDEK